MIILRKLALTALAGCALAAPARAQTTLTMSSWVSPQHHLTSVVLQGFGDEVEKASGGRLKFQMLPKHPSAPPGTFDAVRDGLVDVSYVTASYTPARHVLPLVAELPGAGETAEINSVADNGMTPLAEAICSASSPTGPARCSIPSGRSRPWRTCKA